MEFHLCVFHSTYPSLLVIGCYQVNHVFFLICLLNRLDIYLVISRFCKLQHIVINVPLKSCSFVLIAVRQCYNIPEPNNPICTELQIKDGLQSNAVQNSKVIYYILNGVQQINGWSQVFFFFFDPRWMELGRLQFLECHCHPTSLGLEFLFKSFSFDILGRSLQLSSYFVLEDMFLILTNDTFQVELEFIRANL